MPDFVLLSRLERLGKEFFWLTENAWCEKVDRLIAEIGHVEMLNRNRHDNGGTHALHTA